MFQSLDTLLNVYGVSGAKNRFHLYQNMQKAPRQMIQMLTYGTAKYNRSRRNKKEMKKRRDMKRRRKENSSPDMPNQPK